MKLRHLIVTCLLLGSLSTVNAQTTPALDDPSVLSSVMQYSASSDDKKDQLQKQMVLIRDYLREQPGCVDVVLMQNANDGSKPDFVGIARWTDLKSWENVWLDKDFQQLVKSVTQLGKLTPGMFLPLK